MSETSLSTQQTTHRHRRLGANLPEGLLNKPRSLRRLPFDVLNFGNLVAVANLYYERVGTWGLTPNLLHFPILKTKRISVVRRTAAVKVLQIAPTSSLPAFNENVCFTTEESSQIQWRFGRRFHPAITTPVHTMSRFYICSVLLLLFALAFPANAVEVKIDGSQRFQTIEGFGTCLVAWQAPMRELYRTEEFQDTYVNGMGCTMLRVNMWGPTLPNAQSDWRQISHTDFDMQASRGRPQIFVDFGKAIRQHEPNSKLIGTVWSPPAWMKENDSITDERSSGIRANDYRGIRNRVKKEFYPHFCKWMVEYVKKHDSEGAPLYAVSPGNEVQFSQSFESCVWDADDYVIILSMLRTALDREGYQDVKIFGPETMTSHMYDGGTGTYIEAIKKDKAAFEAIDVFATHGYEDGVVEEMSANSSRVFWKLIQETGKPFWITEGGTGGHDWPVPIQKGVANAIHNALVGGNCSAFVPWQICEREKSTHGLMLTSGYTDKSHAARHYFKFIRPGAVRIATSPAFGPIQVASFLHESDQQLVVVAINSANEEQTLEVTMKNVPKGKRFELIRTSDDFKFQNDGNAKIELGSSTITMPPMSILTAVMNQTTN